MKVRTVRVDYHREPEGWWADSPDVPGFVAAGNNLHEVRELVREGIPYYLENQALDLRECYAGIEALVVEVDAGSALSAQIGSYRSSGVAWAEHLTSKGFVWRLGSAWKGNDSVAGAQASPA